MGNYKKQRDDNKKRERLAIIKYRLENYHKDLIIMEKIEDEIRELKNSLYTVSSGRSSTEAVKGGGTSQEDTVNKKLDKIEDLERQLTVIKLENRALRNAIQSLPDGEMMGIVMRVWVYKSHTMRGLESVYHMGKSTIWRRSDTALLYLYKVLYQLNGGDVDPK